MSPTDSTRTSRRLARTKRHRPTLVTAEELEQSTVSEETAGESEVAVEAVPATSPKRAAGFLAKAEDEQENAVSSEEQAKARLARATRGKTPAKETPLERPKETKKESTRGASTGAAQPARSGFKPRYILGMAIYLLASNIIGVTLTGWMGAQGWDRELFKPNIFGYSFPVQTSTLIFLAVLILLLVVLAKFDLLPTRMSTARDMQARKTTTTSAEPREKRAQPTVRQGEKGPDDDLYAEYQRQQRRKK